MAVESGEYLRPVMMKVVLGGGDCLESWLSRDEVVDGETNRARGRERKQEGGCGLF